MYLVQTTTQIQGPPPPPSFSTRFWVLDPGFPWLKKGLDLPSLASIPRIQDPRSGRQRKADHIWQESKIQNPRSGTRGQGPPPPHGLRRVNLEILDPGSWIFTMTKLGRCFHELRLIRPHEDPPGLPRASRAGPESKVEWGELCEDPQVPSQTGHSVALSRDRILSLATLKIHSLSHRPVRLECKIHHYCTPVLDFGSWILR